jgi:hypothetical protein
MCRFLPVYVRERVKLGGVVLKVDLFVVCTK